MASKAIQTIDEGPRLPPLKLLAKAMLMVGREGTGLCIHRSAAFVFEVPGSVLVFGTFMPPPEPVLPYDSAVPFIHCWAEFKGYAYAPTTVERTGGRLHPMHREGYYAVNGARDIHRLARPELLRLDRQHGLKRHLRLGVPCKGGVSFGGTLMDAAGVRWTDDGEGGVVPIAKEGE